MKRVYKNTDLKLYVDEFRNLGEKYIIKFYTTNKDFFIEKTDENVIVDSGREVIKLNWSELETIGDGVMNYTLYNIEEDHDYDDGVYDSTYSRTTEYYILSKVRIDDEDATTSMSQIIDEMGTRLDQEITRSTDKDIELEEMVEEYNSKVDNIEQTISDLDLENYATKTEIDTELSNKQDKIYNGFVSQIVPDTTGRPLPRLQLVNQAGQNVTVICTAEDPYSGWNQGNDTSLATIGLIKSHIPTVPTNVSAFTNDAGYLTQHQSLTGYATETWVGQQGYLTQHQDISGKANVGDSYTKAQSDAKYAATNTIARVATSGDYDDLSNKPTIPTVPTNVSAFTNDSGYLTQHQDISGKANSSDLATVATSGSYNDLSNKPTIPTVPTNVSAFTNDSGYLTQHQSLANYYTKSEVDSAIQQSGGGASGGITQSDLNNGIYKEVEDGEGNIQTYNYLTDNDIEAIFDNGISKSVDTGETDPDTGDPIYEPSPYVCEADLENYATKAWVGQQGYLTQHQDITGKANVGDSYTKAQSDAKYAIANNLSTVATSGSYNDLTNKPTIPTVPTNVSAFTNDAGYLTQHQSLSDYATTSAMNTALATKQNTLTAGVGISITNNVISATGGGGASGGITQTDLNNGIYCYDGGIDEDTGDAFGYKYIHENDLQTYLDSGINKTIDTGETDPETGDPIYESSPYVCEADLTSYATKTWVGQQGYLTQHQSLSNYYTKTEIDNKIGNIETLLAAL